MKPVFVQTANVKHFYSTMALVDKRHGHDSFGVFYGRAGRGKTKTAKHYAVQNGAVYIESKHGWSELWMYMDILAAMGVSRGTMPQRKKGCFELILELSQDQPRTMFLDEADLIGPKKLECIRDLCKCMMVPWVLIGEESLPIMIGRDRRVWSRQVAMMEFAPMEASDIIALAKEATDAGLHVSAQVAAMIQQKTGGDIRLIELILSNSEPIAKNSGSKEITEEIAKRAMARMDLGRRMAS